MATYKRSIAINDLNPDMIKMILSRGYRMPCVDISHMYGRSAKFFETASGDFELAIYRHDSLVNGKIDDPHEQIALYLIPA